MRTSRSSVVISYPRHAFWCHLIRLAFSRTSSREAANSASVHSWAASITGAKIAPKRCCASGLTRWNHAFRAAPLFVVIGGHGACSGRESSSCRS